MADFGEWLNKQKADQDGGLKILQDLAKAKAAEWKGASVASYAAIVQSVPDDQRNLAMSALGRYHERWLQQGQPLRIGVGQAMLAIAGLALAACLLYGVFLSPTFMPSLGEIDQARGLITFLFAFGTIGIAIITSVSVLWMDVSEINERISKAKDLLAILMGVLGTIVGFYFGSATGTATKVAVAEVTLQPASTTPGSPVTVTARATGGAGPYRYDIIGTDPANKVAPTSISVLDKVSATGEISAQLPVPKEVEGNLDVKVSVVDSKGVQGVSKSVTLKVAVPSAPANKTGAGAGGKGEAAKTGDTGKPPVAPAKQSETVKPEENPAPAAPPSPGETKQ